MLQPVTTPELSRLSDRDLWRRAGEGDAEAFAELFDRHADALYGFCFRRTADRSAAEDLVSTTFLHAWRRRSEVQMSGESVLPWLYGVAANLIRRHRRSLHRRCKGLERFRALVPGDENRDRVSEQIEAEERMRVLLGMLGALRQEEQDVFALCIWQGLSYQEAAVALALPVGTVRSRLARARAHLRDPLTEPSPERGDEDDARTREGQREGADGRPR